MSISTQDAPTGELPMPYESQRIELPLDWLTIGTVGPAVFERCPFGCGQTSRGYGFVGRHRKAKR